MAKTRKVAASIPADRYNEAIAALEGAVVALVEMTTSEDVRHAQCSAFTLLNLGETGVSGLASVFHRTRDALLRHRIVALLRGASFTHSESVVQAMRPMLGLDDLDPLLMAVVRSSFAEAVAMTVRSKGVATAGNPTSASSGGDPIGPGSGADEGSGGEIITPPAPRLHDQSRSDRDGQMVEAD